MKDLEMRLSWIIQMAPKWHPECPQKRGDRHTAEGGGHQKVEEAEDDLSGCSVALQTPWSWTSSIHCQRITSAVLSHSLWEFVTAVTGNKYKSFKRCVAAFQCGFNLNFSNDKWWPFVMYLFAIQIHLFIKCSNLLILKTAFSCY